MESRFSKYKSEGKAISSHIANVNSFINFLYKSLDIVEAEIKDLKSRIDEGAAPKIFENKVDLLIALGESIENVYETYHFNKDKVA